MTTFGIRVAVNGSETDVDVTSDSAPWDSKISNVVITAGGGGATRASRYHQLSCDIHLRAAYIAQVRTITIAVQGPFSGTAPAGTIDAGGGERYRVLFHGIVNTIAGGLNDAGVRVVAQSAIQSQFQQRPTLAAASNTSPYDLAVSLASDVSCIGSTMLPDTTCTLRGGELIKQYMPAQKGVRVTNMFSAALAGTGVNLVGGFGNTITSPQLLFRPDYFRPGAAIDTSRQETITLARPNLWDVTDLGVSFEDAAAKFVVYGEDSGGTRYKGWARFESATDREALGRTEQSLSGWWNTAARCEGAARELLQLTCFPSGPRPYQIRNHIDSYSAGMAGWGGDGVRNVWVWAAAQVGDLALWQISGDSYYESLTGALGFTTARSSDLSAIFSAGPTLGGPNKVGTYWTRQWIVRGTRHEWNPIAGWTVDLQLSPDYSTTSLTSSYGSETL